MHVRWASDHGLLISFDDDDRAATRARVHGALAALGRAAIPGLVNLHPAYASILAVCNVRRYDPDAFEAGVRQAVADSAEAIPLPSRLIDVPVCYARELAPDLDDVARHSGLDAEDVIARHAAAAYVVAFLGFSPGFPYLDGLPPELATPRLTTPRRRIEPGSVAIGGAQTGIYPAATPGGWRVIGRTPSILFDVAREPMALLAPGDRVRFSPIDVDAFRAMDWGGA